MPEDPNDDDNDSAEQTITDAINDLRESHNTLNELFGAMDNLQHIDTRNTSVEQEDLRQLIKRELYALSESIDDVESASQPETE